MLILIYFLVDIFFWNTITKEVGRSREEGRIQTKMIKIKESV